MKTAHRHTVDDDPLVPGECGGNVGQSRHRHYGLCYALYDWLQLFYPRQATPITASPGGTGEPQRAGCEAWTDLFRIA